MKLSSLLNKKLIFYDISGDNREDIYRKMLNRTINKLSLSVSIEEILKQIIKREDAISIPYEQSFAYPHLRLKEIDDLYISIAVLPKPVLIKPEDKEPSQIITMCLISNNTSSVYLTAISAITRFIIKDDNINKLIKSKNQDEFFRILEKQKIELKHSITAEDIMLQNYESVYENDTIEKVLDILNSKQVTFLPVFDKNKKFIGVINAVSIIKKHVPKYLMMLDNFEFLKGFEPFENLINLERTIFVKEFVEKPEKIIAPDTPLIQIALSLIKDDVKKIFVIDENGIFKGIITMKEIIHKILRGQLEVLI